SPGALARYAPVGAAFHCGFDSTLAPIGNPGDVVDLVEGSLAKIRVVDLDEPLIHGSEDHGRFTAPAMRITVMIAFLVQQRFAETQLVQNGLVGFADAMLFQDRFAEHLGRHLLLEWQIVRVGETSVIVDGGIDRQATLHAEVIIFQAVAGGDVDETGTGNIIDERISLEKLSGPLTKRMLILESAELGGVEAADDF